MAELKLTKNELRDQQIKLTQLERYLPTLQLKKAMLQTEVQLAVLEIEALQKNRDAIKEKISRFQSLLTDPSSPTLFNLIKIEDIHKRYENVAGVEIPHFEKVVFGSQDYPIYTTPLWFDQAIVVMKELLVEKQKILIAEEKKAALEKDLREVSIRVNLFEKILIPRIQGYIKKIKVFLGDQQLSAVAQAKVAKQKIILRKKEHSYA